MRYSWFDSTTDYDRCPDGEIGRLAALKMLFAVRRVPVRLWLGAQCNDSETNNGTDAMYEMETNETQ